MLKIGNTYKLKSFDVDSCSSEFPLGVSERMVEFSEKTVTIEDIKLPTEAGVVPYVIKEDGGIYVWSIDYFDVSLVSMSYVTKPIMDSCTKKTIDIDNSAIHEICNYFHPDIMTEEMCEPI